MAPKTAATGLRMPLSALLGGKLGQPCFVGKKKISGIQYSVEECLQSFTRGERIEDVECQSCSASAAKDIVLGNIAHAEPLAVKEPLVEVVDMLDRWLLSGDSEPWAERIADELGENVDFPHTVVRGMAEKKLLVSRLPTALCLHIGRRVPDYLTCEMRKLGQHVRFPLTLDMSPYVDNNSMHHDNRVRAPHRQTRALMANHSYKLKSVIVHAGTANEGILIDLMYVFPFLLLFFFQ